MKRKYVPIDDRGYRIPIDEWSKKDRITFDGALPRGARDDEIDPQNTNSGATYEPDGGTQETHFVKGGLADYARRDALDDEDDDLSNELIEALCEHAGESLGFSDDMVDKLRGRLRGNVAQDEPKDLPGGGMPKRGGRLTALKEPRNERAMDAKGSASFQSRWPDAARISAEASRRREPRHALDAKQRDSAGFARRWPDVAKIKLSY